MFIWVPGEDVVITCGSSGFCLGQCNQADKNKWCTPPRRMPCKHDRHCERFLCTNLCTAKEEFFGIYAFNAPAWRGV